jgi:uncharacterized membrane protein YkoI
VEVIGMIAMHAKNGWKRARASALAAALLALTAPALAQSGAPTLLSVAEIIDRLAKLGYTDVLEVELERDRYEAEARGSDGHWYEVEVDARTGELVHVEPDRD